MAAPRPGEHQRPEPVGGVEGAAAAEVGTGHRPLRQRRRLRQAVSAGRGERAGGVCRDGAPVTDEGRGQGQHGLVMGRGVAPAGAPRGPHAFLGVGAGLGVPSGAQFGVGEVLEGPGLERGGVPVSYTHL